MSNKKSLFDRNKSAGIFKPKFRNTSLSFLKDKENKNLDLTLLADTNIENSSSFRYGNKKELVSTQQVRTDFSNFVNHTFFHSAVANVNESFDKIINFYPFNGTNKEIEKFEDELTGFEKYILDNFPKNVGYLIFSGTQKGESSLNGTYINVTDAEGSKYTSISSIKSAKGILDPKQNPLTITMFCKLPEIANDNQIILQKRSSLSNNFTLAISESASTTDTKLLFGITSGSNFSFISGSITKGDFVNIAAIYDPQGDEKTKLIIGENIFSSSMNVVFDSLDYSSSNLTIGTGTQVRINNVIFDQQQTFSGSIDELRYYHYAKNESEINNEKYTSVFPDENLKLYFKFNEPHGNYSANQIILDSSKSNLHSKIENYLSNYSRLTGSDNPVKNEIIKRHPVLFPDFADVENLNIELLTSGSEYDQENPNLITKLIPPHYFIEANNQENFNDILGNLGNNFADGSNKFPGKKINEIPGATLLVKFLLSWAKFFDEMKIFVDAITSTNNVSYEDFDTTPDVFLKRRAEDLNITLPNLFGSAELSQLLQGINLTEDYANATLTLNEIQNLIWRRIISDSVNMKLTKGTIDSIKSVFRSAGIEPDNILTFREYGGSKINSLESSREEKIDVLSFLNFSGSKDALISGYDAQGYPINNIPRIKSNYLSGSRVEPGVPYIGGNFVNGISNNVNDGLYTSGSFTYEGLYKYISPPSGSQSLIRLHTTGSIENVIINLISDTDESLNLFIRETSSGNVKNLFLTGINIYDEDVWHISFGSKGAHDIGNTDRSIYFLRAAKQESGDIIEYYQTSSHYAIDHNSILKNISSDNTSGSFLVVSRQNFATGTDYLNSTLINTLAHSSSFDGLVSNCLFWSKYIEDTEWKEHVKNHTSVGVLDPKKNYNFEKNISGSFERLIIQTNGNQATTSSNTLGEIRFFDFSQNNIHFEGSKFESSKLIMKPVSVQFEILSSLFDTNIAKNKIRVRSYQDSSMIEESNFAQIAPVYQIPLSEENIDDNRFSIDMSVFRGLNENAMTMFSNFSGIDNALGKPNNLYGDTYIELDHLRNIFFNNVLEKVNLEKFRTIFKWIDNSFTDIVFSMIPKTTVFMGINFIYESHVLERNKIKYLSDEIYLKSLPRDESRGNLRLSQFSGKIRKV
jgi:hypothetical protein